MRYMQNILAFWRKFPPESGFDILTGPHFYAVKAPVKIEGVHFVCGAITEDNIRKAKAFFGKTPFTWFVEERQKNETTLLEKSGLHPEGMLPEMTLDLTAYARLMKPDKTIVDIKLVTTLPLLKKWTRLASEIFHQDEAELFSFMRLAFDHKIKGFLPFIAYYRGSPAAISLVHVDGETLGLYYIGVLKRYRGYRLGIHIVEESLKAVPSAKKAVLQSMRKATKLYEKVGFTITQALYNWAP